ncbi:helix-turn-helix transcriptional regulator [Paraburkholderia bonniea]|uniref:helix-turn-helix transcriptional regulator n=1 Tax=Paraburkholderia bonniea TaxID=2152891 RepID=UPI00157FEE57|nr:helix-turn-helix transcriptional regulator [Paraburkholderia bonniea]WJF91901.1 helix-turn-helix transcriptional regulator [Paraburkholderia bonniea]WJF95220.1 helix-turn-helix transcriptional regulator [Paraburkholderia bonniea]
MELVEMHRQEITHNRVMPIVPSDRSSAAVDRARIIEYRKKKKESQRRFWARFGVTQSRGSRFEAGAEIPAPVSILLGLYFTKTVSDGDLGRAERLLYSWGPASMVSQGR